MHRPVGLFSTNDAGYVAWDDSRNATGESKAQDIYFTRVDVDGTPALAGATGTTGTSRLQWAALGAAVGLVACGLALGAARAVCGSPPERAPTR